MPPLVNGLHAMSQMGLERDLNASPVSVGK